MVSFGHFCLPNYLIVTRHPSPAIFLCQTPQITPNPPAAKSLTEKKTGQLTIRGEILTILCALYLIEFIFP